MPHSDLLKIKTTVQMANFSPWRVHTPMLLMPYPQKQEYLLYLVCSHGARPHEVLQGFCRFVDIIYICNESSWFESIWHLTWWELRYCSVCASISNFVQPRLTTACGAISGVLRGSQEPLLATVKRWKLAWFEHATRHSSLSIAYYFTQRKRRKIKAVLCENWR